MADDLMLADDDVVAAIIGRLTGPMAAVAKATRPLEVRRPYVDLGAEAADRLLHHGLQVRAHLALLEAEFGALEIGIVGEFDRFVDLLVITRDRLLALSDEIETEAMRDDLSPGAASVARRHALTIRGDVLVPVETLYEATVTALAEAD